jgi:hypothetical protein
MCASKRGRKFRRKFRHERDLSRQIIYKFMNKLRKMGLLMDKKKHKR